MARNQEDMSARTGLSLSKWRPHTPQERAVEYLLFDQEYSQTPDESSWFASAWVSEAFHRVTSSLPTQIFREVIIRTMLPKEDLVEGLP